MNELDTFAVANHLPAGAPPPSLALPAEEAIRYACALAQALKHIHLAGGVCGNLDPDHIVWTSNGVSLTRNGAGTLTPYLAPEQLRGDAADTRTDVFAFGAIVYELLAGRRAFPASTPEELRQQILEQEPAPLTGLPGELAFVLQRCLEKQPQKRWQRVSSIVVELKLAAATARVTQQAAEWKDRVSSLRAQIASHDTRLAANEVSRALAESQTVHSLESLKEHARQQAEQLEQANQRVATLETSVAELQQTERIHARAIESIEASTAQTDEVVEHVVEAFGLIHKSVVDHAEPKALVVSRNGD